MSPAGRGARLPGEAPQTFCERCGRSVDAAKIAQRVGLCHCPSCDLFACRSCWSEAAEACPGCGVSFVEASAAERHSDALAAGALAANALRSDGLATAQLAIGPEKPGVWAKMRGSEVPAAWAAVPAPEPPTTIGSRAQATRRWKTRGVPVGLGLAVVGVAVFALVLGDPFKAGGVEGATNAPDSPAGSTTIRASAGAGAGSPVSAGSPTVDASTDPATGPIAQPPGGTTQTPRPTAAVTDRPGATATPGASDPGATPTPAPPATAAPTATPSPTPTPVATPTPEPPPSCRVVPDLVGLTVANARSTWTDAGFIGGFSPNGQNKRIVTGQSRPPGACLPPSTSIAVNT